MGEERREGRADQPSDRSRLTVPEAARVLGISPEAVRNRLSRGTLQRVKEGGTVYVLIDRDMARPIDDISLDISGELIDTLKEQNAYLRDQLQQERDANRENRRIIAALTSRIPEIEAPSEPRESPTGATEQPGRVEPQPSVEGTQAQESPEMAMPEAGGGPLPHDQQRASERRWWQFWR